MRRQRTQGDSNCWGHIADHISGLVTTAHAGGNSPPLGEEESDMAEKETAPDGYEVIYRTSITTRSGKRIYAYQYGLKAFRLLIRKA